MSRVLVNDTLRSLLHNLSEPLEFHDESGRVMGRFLPEIDLSDYEPWEPPPLTKEELQRRAQESESFTTTEMLAYLEKLRCSESSGNGQQ